MVLVSIARDEVDFAATLRHARELVTLDRGNARLHVLVSDLEKPQAHEQARYLPSLCGRTELRDKVRNWHRLVRHALNRGNVLVV
jgi:hypothetical protein